MELKAEYLNSIERRDKGRYLDLFKESNNWIANHYSGLLMDSWSFEYLKCIDIDKHKQRRQNNAKILYTEVRYS